MLARRHYFCAPTSMATLLFAALTLLGGASAGAGTAEPAHVTYVSGDSIYLDAGADRGLHQGDVLEVVRDGEVVVLLVVRELSTRRAVARAADDSVTVVVGDTVRWSALEATTDDAAPESEPPIRISHIDETAVYLDSGSNRGLKGGERLRVVRDDAIVGFVQVTDVSRESATALVLDDPGLLQAGDAIRLPAPVVETAAAPPEPSPTARSVEAGPRRSRRDRVVRGRIGLRYLQVSDDLTGQSDFSQPALSVRFDANGAGGGRFDLAIDTRARTTYRTPATGPDEQDNQTRVYRLAASVHDPRSRHVMVVGRQFSPEVASISVFDGVLLALNREHVSTGVFSGSQPEPVDYGYDRTIQEHGAYLQFHNKPEAVRRWSVTTGVVGSYQDGEINREFAYFQLLVTGRRASVYATQELDYNRDWKLVAGEDPYELTSSYVNVGYRIGKGFSVRLGHDDRRNIRLYRDLITPETEFDDSFRTGTWIGFTQRVGKRFRFGLDAKHTDGENAEPADTYTLTLGANRLSSQNLSFNYRGTRYSNEFSEGDLHSLNVSVSLARWARMALTGGLREDHDLLDPLMDDKLVWYGLELDFNVGRQWFLQVSSERTDGEFDKNTQNYFGMTYRF